jgi:hypothetical protein
LGSCFGSDKSATTLIELTSRPRIAPDHGAFAVNPRPHHPKYPHFRLEFLTDCVPPSSKRSRLRLWLVSGFGWFARAAGEPSAADTGPFRSRIAHRPWNLTTSLNNRLTTRRTS